LFTEIVLPENIKEIYLGDNFISKLDVLSMPSALAIPNNHLIELNIPLGGNMNRCEIENNFLKMSTMPIVATTYAPQATIYGSSIP
jgi:hypothetical protein